MDAARTDLLERLAAGPARIGELARVAAAPPDRPSGAWSAHQNVGHLVLVERQVFQARLADLTARGIPTWTWTEPGTSDGAGLETLDAALDAFATARAETVAWVSAFDDAGWARFGQHATYGRLDVVGLLEVVVDHDDHHRADIAKLLEMVPKR